MSERWYAIDEKGNDNFATSIYEAGDKGLLVARCNQNGQYPWQGPAIIRGLEANKHLPDAPQRVGWQPYATAPRDGTPILCYWGPSVPGGARAIDVAVWIDGNWCDADDAETHFGEPDLWQPLDWPSLSRPEGK